MDFLISHYKVLDIIIFFSILVLVILYQGRWMGEIVLRFRLRSSELTFENPGHPLDAEPDPDNAGGGKV
jgi:hypothetical protein